MVLNNDSGHLMCQLEDRRGNRKGSSFSSTHIPATRFHHIFSPLKRGEEGAYYTIFKNKAFATGKYFV